MLFKNKQCTKCGLNYDSEKLICPSCGAVNESNCNKRSGKGITVIPYFYQIIYFAIGSLGLSFVSTIFSIFAILTNMDLYSIQTTAFINFSTYIILFLGFAILTILSKEDIFKSFTKLKPYIAGIVCGIVLILFSIFYGMLISNFHEGVNGNQQTSIDMVVSYPILSIIVLGFLGPMCEELTYRLGLFTFANRINRYLAYAVVSIVFGFIHFDSSSSDIVLELLYLPDYLFAGFALAYTYDHYGLAASTSGHIINNLYSVIGILILNA